MTKKHYDLIAAQLLNTYIDTTTAQAIGIKRVDWQFTVAITAQRIAKGLQADNPRFDINRFLAACSCYPKNPDGTQQSL